MAKFYSIPFSFEDLLNQENEELKVDLAESIGQNISLIITSQLGEFRYDSTFGCKIWDIDFIVPSDISVWQDDIKKSIRDAVLRHEHRIEQLTDFDVRVVGTEKGSKLYLRRIHQRVDIRIAGIIRGNKERITFNETLYFSPVSLS